MFFFPNYRAEDGAKHGGARGAELFSGRKSALSLLRPDRLSLFRLSRFATEEKKSERHAPVQTFLDAEKQKRLNRSNLRLPFSLAIPILCSHRVEACSKTIVTS